MPGRTGLLPRHASYRAEVFHVLRLGGGSGLQWHNRFLRYRLRVFRRCLQEILSSPILTAPWSIVPNLATQPTWDDVNTIPGVSVCSRVCDPVKPQNPRSPLLACPVGFGCCSMGTSYPGASDCESQSGSGVSGSTCSTDDDCTPGFYCSCSGTPASSTATRLPIARRA